MNFTCHGRKAKETVSKLGLSGDSKNSDKYYIAKLTTRGNNQISWSGCFWRAEWSGVGEYYFCYSPLAQLDSKCFACITLGK